MLYHQQEPFRFQPLQNSPKLSPFFLWKLETETVVDCQLQLLSADLELLCLRWDGRESLVQLEHTAVVLFVAQAGTVPQVLQDRTPT
jgi:hypothetical protein